MDIQNIINEQATQNYSNKSPWPEADEWHEKTYINIFKFVTKKLKKYSSDISIILNAGSGGTVYPHAGKMIHLDIVDTYIKNYLDYIVASVDKIPMQNESVDIIICVGSVINYADYQKTLKEFSRILKPNGVLILEFERSNSGEFLFTKKHNKLIFHKTYHYNNQQHVLWMYNERNILKTMKLYNLKTIQKHRFHTVSTLLNRFGMSEKKASKYSMFDFILAPVSYHLAHNCILVSKKISKI